jgi:hypothetical protein
MSPSESLRVIPFFMCVVKSLCPPFLSLPCQVFCPHFHPLCCHFFELSFPPLRCFCVDFFFLCMVRSFFVSGLFCVYFFIYIVRSFLCLLFLPLRCHFFVSTFSSFAWSGLFIVHLCKVRSSFVSTFSSYSESSLCAHLIFLCIVGLSGHIFLLCGVKSLCTPFFLIKVKSLCTPFFLIKVKILCPPVSPLHDLALVEGNFQPMVREVFQ